MRRAWALTALPLVTALPLLAGCGVRETGVIGAGGPATVDVFPGRDARMLLFFVSPEGEPLPVARPFEAQPPPVQSSGNGTTDTRPTGPGVAKTVAALLAGPSNDERSAGVTTELPTIGRDRSGTPVSVRQGRDRVDVTVGLAVGELSPAAVRQLVCTIAYAADINGAVEVAVSGAGATLPAVRCDRDAPTPTWAPDGQAQSTTPAPGGSTPAPATTAARGTTPAPATTPAPGVTP
ncbi:hypothetical protein [Streptomyces sp. NPDC047928]|uniref:hypothetical protein n=1 Tax=unclassified Streptomyces TaxID=2593676 RepID=UPI0037156EF2